MKDFDYIIVGGGLYGGIFAYMAGRRGKRCLIVEKRNHLGGNLYCQNIEGIPVHVYGAHIFHTSNAEVWEFVNQLTEFNHFINSPMANYKGEMYNLPFNMNTFNKMWNVTTPDQAQKIIEEQRQQVKGEPKNLEEQAIRLVGTDIYEKLVKGYTEKQWGRECKDLPAFIIKRLPVRYTYDNNYFNDKYQGIPVGGYQALINKLFETSDVALDSDYLKQKEYFNSLGEKVLYTGMIDAYYDYCYGELEYRSLKFETEILEKENYQGVAVVNYTDSDTSYTRMIEHKHFDFGTQKKTVITKEYPADWKKGMEPYYPINNELNQNLYEKYAGLAMKEKRTLFGGRLAEYRYYDMDKVIESALSLCKREL